MQDRISGLRGLLTGQCCLSAQTEISGDSAKRHAALEHLEVDFTEIKPHRHYCYLLVVVCMLLGWVDAFLTRTERASEVGRCLLREIVPRFGSPTSIGSDNGPAFVADLVQRVSKT